MADDAAGAGAGALLLAGRHLQADNELRVAKNSKSLGSQGSHLQIRDPIASVFHCPYSTSPQYRAACSHMQPLLLSMP